MLRESTGLLLQKAYCQGPSILDTERYLPVHVLDSSNEPDTCFLTASNKPFSDSMSDGPKLLCRKQIAGFMVRQRREGRPIEVLRYSIASSRPSYIQFFHTQKVFYAQSNHSHRGRQTRDRGGTSSRPRRDLSHRLEALRLPGHPHAPQLACFRVSPPQPESPTS